MGFQLKENEYYLIKQIIEDKKATQFKLHNTNEESVIKFTRILAGTVVVYIYNEDTNKRIDVTNKLGRSYYQLEEHKPLVLCDLYFKSKEMKNLILYNAWMYEDIARYILGNNRFFETMYYVERYKTSNRFVYVYSNIKNVSFKIDNTEKKKEKNKKVKIYGDEFEKFIGQKYESLGQNVIYHGLNKGKKDNGIDLIIDSEKTITFVQCKNWKSMGHYKLNQKDLRAFIGDCYMYMFNNNIDKKHNFHFIVSDTELLTKSAEIYVKENKKLKYKVIPFEE